MTSPDTTTQALPDDFGRAFITGVHETLSNAADALGDLDRRSGDGDFGTNIRTAMRLAETNIAEDDPSTYREWMTCMSMAWLGVGGTSGPLLGMFFRDLAKAADGDSTPTVQEFAEALAAGQATVQKYGEAKVGDKTMVDAMEPAVNVLREAAEAGKSAADALDAAEDSAVQAARNTADVIAHRGRSSYVGEASRGVIDPGAAAIALLVGAARVAAAGRGTVDTKWVTEA